jgi:hypothetical protein
MVQGIEQLRETDQIDLASIGIGLWERAWDKLIT